MSSGVDSSFFRAEATLRADLPCYVERQADAELLKALHGEKFTVILSSRKVGKSSLMERAFATLQTEGVCVVKKELAEGDKGITVESWYAGLVEELVNDAKRRNKFEVDSTWRSWWNERANLPPGQRFTDFLQKFFLEPSTQPWVIALDEIDTTIPLPFSDDFFAAIRRCNNARASDPQFRRLTFLLAGVASPAQLIKDNRRTPFNIGHSLSITDFTAEEAKVLLAGLGLPVVAEHPALQRVLHWTNGHPYLTQRILLKLAEDLEDEPQPSDRDWKRLVDQVVGSTFLRPGARTNEAHLEDIAKRRIGDLNKPGNPNFEPGLKRRMLMLYRSAWQGHVVKDDAVSKSCVELKLCGLLVTDREDPSRLVVRNLIYRTVFDANWIRSEMPKNQWKRIAVMSVLMSGMIMGGFAFSQRHYRMALENQQIAEAIMQRTKRIADLAAQIERAETDVPTVAYAQLLTYSGQEEHAKSLIAGYWARRARIASVERPRDEAAIMWLKVLSNLEQPEARLQARRALSGSMRNVLATFRHSGTVNHAAFSPDGRRVITASGDSTARVWDAETGRPVGSPLKHEGRVFYAEFSANGSKVVTASNDNTARVWDATTAEPIGSPLKHEGAVIHAKFSWDGSKVVTASSDGTARIWDAKYGQPIGSPLHHNGWVVRAEFSKDGLLVVTASSDQTAQVWNVETAQPLGRPLKHSSVVSCAEFSADGRWVVTGSIGAQIWDAKTGEPIGSPLKHDGGVLSAKFSADGLKVVTASEDNTARIWDAKTCQPLGSPWKHESAVLHAAFSHDGQRVVTTSDYTSQVWDARSGEPIGSPLKHEDGVSHAAFSPDGRRVVTASHDMTARVWDAEAGQPLGSPLPTIDPHAERKLTFNHAEFSTDGTRVVTACDDKTARIWDAETKQLIGPPLKHEGRVFYAEFSADGSKVVTASNDNTARVWDATTGQPIGPPLNHERPVNQGAFNADGRLVVTASDDSTARVWDAQSGEPVGSVLKHASIVNQAAFSLDGRRVVTASDDSTARVWDVQSGEPVGVTLKHQFDVLHAAFSADGRRVVTASGENAARVWDAKTNRLLCSPLRHKSPVFHAEFSVDGQRLVTTTKTALTWFIEQSPSEWQPQATVWANGTSWKSSPLLPTPNGYKIRIADSWTADVLLIRDLNVNESENGLPELDGRPTELLEKYLKRFALEFVNDQISPTLKPNFIGD